MVLLMIVQIDILLSSLLGIYKVSGDVMVPGQYHTCCCCWTCSWPSLLFKLLLSFVFGLLTHFFQVGFCLSHALWLVAVWCQIWNIYNFITWFSQCFSGWNLRWRYYSYEDMWDWHWRSLELLEALPVCWQTFEIFFNNFFNRQVRKESPSELVASREVFNQTRSWEDIQICTNNMTMMGIHKN